MEWLQVLVELLKYVLPAVLVLLGVKLMMDYHLKKDAGQQNHLLRAEVVRQHLPLKLSAYERALLYLERINPRQLLVMNPGNGKKAQDYYAELIQQIQTEYEHNIVQQVYISNHGWDGIVASRNEIIGLIKESMEGLPPDADGAFLMKKISDNFEERQDKNISNAVLILKADVHKIFSI